MFSLFSLFLSINIMIEKQEEDMRQQSEIFVPIKMYSFS